MRAILAGLAIAAFVATANAAAAESSDLVGTWRLTHGRPAPWWDVALSNPVQIEWVGKTLTFAEIELKGFGPLDCKNAHYATTSVPAEGLFQGGLEADPEKSAATLGLVDGPFAGVSLSCDTGIFEFHQADADTWLFALDNVVWTMSRAYGARARPRSPESVVESLLEAHFNGNLGFTEESVAAKTAWLTRGLAAEIAGYFAKPLAEDVVPVIDGDPFTDSQEYPTRFAVRRGKVSSSRVSVPADFADGYQKRRVVYRLRRESGKWRVDDLIYESGETLCKLLGKKTG